MGHGNDTQQPGNAAQQPGTETRQPGNETRGGPPAPAPTGSTDESIGRPASWREGRYQRSGAPVDQSVNEPSQGEPHDTVGTQTPPASSGAQRPKSPPPEQQKPVTLQDYDP